MLKRALKLKNIRITIIVKPKTSNIILVLKVAVLEFEAVGVVQEARSLVIRIIPKPTRLLY